MQPGTVVFCVCLLSVGFVQATKVDKEAKDALETSESKGNTQIQRHPIQESRKVHKKAVAPVKQHAKYQPPLPAPQPAQFQYQPLPAAQKQYQHQPVRAQPQPYHQPTSVLPRHYQQPPPPPPPQAPEQYGRRQPVYAPQQAYFPAPPPQPQQHIYRQPIYQQPQQQYRQPVYQQPQQQQQYRQPSSSFFDQFFPFRSFQNDPNSALDKLPYSKFKDEGQEKSPGFGRKREYTIRNKNNPNEYMTVKEVQVNLNTPVKSSDEAETAMRSIISSLGGMSKEFPGSEFHVGAASNDRGFGAHHHGGDGLFPF